MKEIDKQIGGEHYKSLEYQPIELIGKLRLGFTQGNVIKYISRFKNKNGLQDIEKALHYCKMAEEGCVRERNHFLSIVVCASQEIDDFCERNMFMDDIKNIITAVCRNDWKHAFQMILILGYEEYSNLFYNGEFYEEIGRDY